MHSLLLGPSPGAKARGDHRDQTMGGVNTGDESIYIDYIYTLCSPCDMNLVLDLEALMQLIAQLFEELCSCLRLFQRVFKEEADDDETYLILSYIIFIIFML